MLMNLILLLQLQDKKEIKKRFIIRINKRTLFIQMELTDKEIKIFYRTQLKVCHILLYRIM